MYFYDFMKIFLFKINHMRKLKHIGSLVLFFLVIINHCYTQSSTNKELTKRLKNTQADTNKINILLVLSQNLRDSYPDSSLNYAHQGVLLAKKVSKSSDESEAKEGKKALAAFYNDIGIIKKQKGNYPEALENYQKSLQIYKKLNDQDGISTNYNSIAIIYYYLGDFSRAIEYYQKAFEIFRKIRSKEGMALSYNNIGMIYSNQGKFTKAIEYYQKSLELKKSLNDKKGIASTYNGIGAVHYYQADYDEAINYFEKSLKIREELNNRKGVAMSLNNIGMIYKSKGDYEQAIKNYKKSLEIREELNDKRGMASNFNNIGSIFLVLKEYNKAEEYYRKALKINKDIGYKKGIIQSLENISSLYIDIGDSSKPDKKARNAYNSAIKYAGKSLEMSKEMKILPRIMQEYKNLSEAYEGLGQHDKALECHKSYTSVKDSIFNKEKNKQIEEIEAKYQTRQKEKQIKLQQAELTNKENQIQRKKFLNYTLAGGIILLLVFGIIILRNYKLKQRAFKLLKKKNQEINNQKIKIEYQNHEITDSIKYAQRIQSAIFPRKNLFSETFADHFILFKPLSIISGDFYWLKKTDQQVVFAVADCTGHGVPGAFMSTLGIAFLEETFRRKDILKASDMLHILREDIKRALQQEGKYGEAKDGMDIALCMLDFETLEMQYAGAYNPLYIIRDNELIEYKATRSPIGIDIKEKPFANNIIQLEKDDKLYLFTDGYVDQIGGENNKKFMPRQFKELLIDISNKPMIEQKRHLDKSIEKWKKGYPQVDDILVMGIKI